MEPSDVPEGRSWEEFRSAGLLWWTNRALHLFGWAIVVEVDDNGIVTKAFPARVKYRGFYYDEEAIGFIQLTRHLHENTTRLVGEVRPEKPSEK